MQRKWHYLTNQFLIATDKNYKLMMRLSNYHDAYLNSMVELYPGVPEYNELYDTYHPAHLLYITKYTKWKQAGGSQKGKTITLGQMLDQLMVNVNNWDVMIQNIDGFKKGTGNYLALFPRGHQPFYRGNALSRINAVMVLGEAMAEFVDDPGIDSIKTDVDALYLELDATKDKQEGAIGGTKRQSEEVEEQRKVVAKEAYSNLALLIHKFVDTPDKVAPFFDLSLLRKSIRTVYNGTVVAGANEAILARTFLEDDNISIEITNVNPAAPTTELTFFLANIAHGTNSDPVLVTANSGKTSIPLSAFGVTEYGTHRYLTAINDTAFDLQYHIELL